MRKNPVEYLYLQQNQLIVHNALERELPPGYSFCPHCHETVEIALVLDGSCDFMGNNEPLPVNTGELCIIFPHTIHGFTVRSKVPCRFLQAHIYPQYFLDIDPHVAQELPFIRHMTDERSAYFLRSCTPELLSCMQRLCRETGALDTPFHRALANTYVVEMIFLLSRDITQTHRQVFTIDNPLAIHAINYINSHIEQKMSLESIAEECHVSSRYLSQVFKKSVNITVNAYISIAKIDRAISYITSEQMQFSEVASILGFSSAQYFSTVFKKYTGVTPSEFLESSSIHSL